MPDNAVHERYLEFYALYRKLYERLSDSFGELLLLSS